MKPTRIDGLGALEDSSNTDQGSHLRLALQPVAWILVPLGGSAALFYALVTNVYATFYGALGVSPGQVGWESMFAFQEAGIWVGTLIASGFLMYSIVRLAVEGFRAVSGRRSPLHDRVETLLERRARYLSQAVKKVLNTLNQGSLPARYRFVLALTTLCSLFALIFFFRYAEPVLFVALGLAILYMVENRKILVQEKVSGRTSSVRDQAKEPATEDQEAAAYWSRFSWLASRVLKTSLITLLAAVAGTALGRRGFAVFVAWVVGGVVVAVLGTIAVVVLGGIIYHVFSPEAEGQKLNATFARGTANVLRPLARALDRVLPNPPPGRSHNDADDLRVERRRRRRHLWKSFVGRVGPIILLGAFVVLVMDVNALVGPAVRMMKEGHAIRPQSQSQLGRLILKGKGVGLVDFLAIRVYPVEVQPPDSVPPYHRLMFLGETNSTVVLYDIDCRVPVSLSRPIHIQPLPQDVFPKRPASFKAQCG